LLGEEKYKSGDARETTAAAATTTTTTTTNKHSRTNGEKL